MVRSSKRRNRLVLSVALMVILLTACTQKTVYHHYQHISTEGWERQDVVDFQIAPIKTSGNYQEEIGVRMQQDFPFTSMSVLVQQTIYPSMQYHYDTLECQFMDQQGKVLGDGISYDQYHFPLKTIALKEGDSLAVSIYHIMKRETLPGITDVGLKLVAE